MITLGINLNLNKNKMNIEELTVAEAKEKLKEYQQLQDLFNIKKKDGELLEDDISHPYEVGKTYWVRTVTMIYVGKLEAVHNQELVLSNASWIADTGRYHDSLKNGAESIEEIEPFVNNINIGRGSIVESTAWDHSLDLKQK